jgi:hypothetical protein
VVPYKGTLSYVFSVKRLASCPGEVVSTFFALTRDGGPTSTVVLRRPVVATEIRERANIAFSLELPGSVYPGRWIYQSSVDSRCPTFQRADALTKFDIEVK